MQKHILYLFTRTPLHVGAGSSVGAIDQPIQRERHTGFPIIPGSSIKGVMADLWNDEIAQHNFKRVEKSDDKTKRDDEDQTAKRASTAAWLFGSDHAEDNLSAAGAIQFSEARLLAFPVRSAKGCFAWVTSPLILRRAIRDGVLSEACLGKNPVKDDQALFDPDGPLALDRQIVLEEYTLEFAGEVSPTAEALCHLFPEDSVWEDSTRRIVVISDGMMTFFTENACEIAQHVRIDDASGTAAEGGLFNQENVPADTLFYATVQFLGSRLPEKKYAHTGFCGKTADNAREVFTKTLAQNPVLQFGADASTGLGYCSVKFANGNTNKVSK